MLTTEKQTSYDRLKIFINEKFDGSLTKFANAIDIAPTIIDIYRRRGTVLPYKHRSKIEALGLSWKWYEFGEGEMLLGKEPQKIESNFGDVHENFKVVIKNIDKLSIQEIREFIQATKSLGEELVS